ncbi:MAG: ATP-binding protein [Lachnospiraceae bacterium]|nr:ATP-binding protein [Lachnospiraceae bacterium]
MMRTPSGMKMLTKLMFRLLPVQILLAAVGSVNGIVSSFFAANFVGVEAMSAVGLYGPVGMLATSISTVLVGGSAILLGKYMGRNEQEKMQNVFSLNLAASLIIALVFIVVFLSFGLFDLTGFLTTDGDVRPYLNQYFLGQAIGMVPLMLGSSFASFLSIENKGRRTLAASLTYIVVNILLNFLFVRVFEMEAFGLALASSLGMWVFLLVQADVYIRKKSHFKLFSGRLNWKDLGEIFRIGLPGAAVNLYQTLRGLIVNYLVTSFVGSAGISAFAAANNLLGVVWAVPAGMLAVSRMMISVSVGEEDRRTLTDVMRVMFSRFIPLMCGIVAVVIVLARPLTGIFYQDPAEPVYRMTVWGLRILPLCMPFSVINNHFTCYGQTSGKHALIHMTSLLDGAVFVSLFTALLIPRLDMNSVYVANVLNGLCVLLVFLGYAWWKNRHFPRGMEELMVIPKDFGVPEEERIDITVRSVDEVVTVSERVQDFCLSRGIDAKNACFAALFLEEMAGNVVEHGFTKDTKQHTIDIRVAHKDGEVILRIRDDCVPFDPGEREKIVSPDDPEKNIGIRMVYRMARKVEYQNILGLNVLTIRI